MRLFQWSSPEPKPEDPQAEQPQQEGAPSQPRSRLADLVRRTKEYGKTWGHLVETKLPGGSLVVNDYTKDLLGRALGNSVEYADYFEARYNGAVHWTQETLVRRPLQQASVYGSALKTIASKRNNVFLRLTIKMVIESRKSGSEELARFDSLEEFTQLFESDPDFKDAQFQQILAAFFKFYAQKLEESPECSEETMLALATEIAARTITEVQVESGALGSALPAALLAAVTTYDPESDVALAHTDFCEQVATQLDKTKSELPLPVLGAILTFHEVAAALRSLHLIWRSALVQSCVKYSQAASESLSSGISSSKEVMSKINSEIVARGQEVRTSIIDILKYSHAALSLDRLYVNFVEGRDCVKAQFVNYIDFERFYSTFVIVGQYSNVFKDSQERTAKMIASNWDIVVDFVQDKRVEVLAFIQEKKYESVLPPRVIAMLSDTASRGQEVLVLSKTQTQKYTEILAEYLHRNKASLIDLLIRVYEVEKELLNKGYVTYQGLSLQEVSETVKYTMNSIKDRVEEVSKYRIFSRAEDAPEQAAEADEQDEDAVSISSAIKGDEDMVQPRVDDESEDVEAEAPSSEDFIIKESPKVVTKAEAVEEPVKDSPVQEVVAAPEPKQEEEEAVNSVETQETEEAIPAPVEETKPQEQEEEIAVAEPEGEEELKEEEQEAEPTAIPTEEEVAETEEQAEVEDEAEAEVEEEPNVEEEKGEGAEDVEEGNPSNEAQAQPSSTPARKRSNKWKKKNKKR